MSTEQTQKQAKHSTGWMKTLSTVKKKWAYPVSTLEGSLPMPFLHRQTCAVLRNKCCRRRSIFAPSPRTLHVAYTVQDLQRYVIGNWCDVSKIGRINKRQTQMRKRRWKLKLKLHCRIDTAFHCMSGSPKVGLCSGLVCDLDQDRL